MTVQPLRRVFTVVNGGTPTSEPENWDGDVSWATPIDLGRLNGARISETQRTLTAKGLRTGSSLVPAGSLIVSTRAPIGYVVETTIPMAFNQGCRGLVPRTELDVRFFRYQLAVSASQLQSRGQGSTFVELSTDGLASLPLAVPSLIEQRAVADYLDAETARIDALIDLRQAQAALASAHVQAVVDSVLDALGPWLSLRRVLAPERDALIAGPFGSQLAGDDLREAGVAGVIDQQLIIGGSFDRPKHFVDEAKWNELRRFAVRPGDVLVSGRGTTGRIAVVPDEVGPAIIHPSVLRVRPDPSRISADFLATCLRWSTRISDYLRLENTATTIDVIYSGTLRGVPIPVPSLTEQGGILRRIGMATSDGHATEQAMRAQVLLLMERRRALVTAAVTGQLEIPGVAA